MNILILSVSILAWGALHSLLASRQVKTSFERWLGMKAMRFYRLAYNLLSILTFLPILWLAVVLPDRQLYAIPLPWLALTLAGQALAAVLLGIGVFQTGLLDFTGLGALAGRETSASKLVTRGLYRFVRHPLYSAGILFIWLTPVMTINLFIILAASTMYIILGAYIEERKLRREFGAEYAAYQAAVPMLIPRHGRRNK